MKNVSIYGAGLSGLVAAINLAREGYGVTVFEREESIGGSKSYHPSIHSTPLQPQETWDYIGVDLSDYFLKTDAYPNMWYNKKQIKLPPYVDNLSVYNVERGSRKTSIDSKLYEVALEEGVNFEFGKALTPQEIEDAPDGSIIGTGLYKEAFELVGMKSSLVYGYMAISKWDENKVGGGMYFGNFSVDYGYSAWMNGLMYVLLFSRNPLSEKKLDHFKKVLHDVEGFEKDKWSVLDNGHFPRETRLFWKNKILTGTLSGMIEPFWGYGVVGALISGKVSALAHMDAEKGTSDFEMFNRGFHKKLARKEKMDRMPFNKLLLLLAIYKARVDCFRKPALKKAVKEPVLWFR